MKKEEFDFATGLNRRTEAGMGAVLTPLNVPGGPPAQPVPDQTVKPEIAGPNGPKRGG